MASALKSRYQCFASAEAFRAISLNGDAVARKAALVLNAVKIKRNR